jgi:hypothetical protein
MRTREINQPEAGTKVSYNLFSTLGSTTVPSGSKTTKKSWRSGPLIVSEKAKPDGSGVVRNF